MEHLFCGKWISNEILASLEPRNVFHRQLDPLPLDCTQYRNRHVLFRRSFHLASGFSRARIFVTADDYYKLYINGRFVAQGPAPSYHFQYNYNEIDVADYLTEGENLIAVHTLYQGLINRVWQSGDLRHGLLCDLEIDGKVVLSSDESFLVKEHSGYSESGICGYDTQFLERYDSRAAEVGFASPDFDDADWSTASVCRFDDHGVRAQKSAMLTFEQIAPVARTVKDGRILYDFGCNFVGYLSAAAKGNSGDVITVRCAQELNEDGSLRYALRANCVYEEEWILSGKEDQLDWFDYKSFRYVELEIPASAEIGDVSLFARHYPFALRATLKKEYANDPDMQRIWALCLHTQRYGVQEVIQDCMEREKGFYLGDGCYTALTHMLLTGDDSMVRKLIDDAFSGTFITDTLVTCMDCSFMQEIAEYPLIMVALILWHYRVMGDRDYLRDNYEKTLRLMEAYRRDYERSGLLRDLDKWCVVEWPKNFQHGYDADIAEGQICHRAHVAINAYYLYAIRITNVMAALLGREPYRDEAEPAAAFYETFYDDEKKLFRDSEGSTHYSLVGNAFAYGLGLCPNAECRETILQMLDESRIDSLSLFCTFPILMRLAKEREGGRLRSALLCDGAWLRILREDGTTTFEGWGKETKWNTSLFHLTMSYAATFLAELDLTDIFE